MEHVQQVLLIYQSLAEFSISKWSTYPQILSEFFNYPQVNLIIVPAGKKLSKNLFIIIEENRRKYARVP